MAEIVEPERKVPVLCEADVVVVGGGAGGIGAALAAARNGAKTILVERFNCLGGAAVTCLNPVVNLVDYAIHGGIIGELTTRLKKGGAVVYDRSYETREKIFAGFMFDGEYLKFLLDNMIEEAGVKLLYHAFCAGAIKEGSTIKGVIIESTEGRHAVLGKIVVDATGSADIAWKSGTPCQAEGFQSGPNKGRHMGYGYSLIMGGVNLNRFMYYRYDHPEDWLPTASIQMMANMKGPLVKKAVAEGKLLGKDMVNIRLLGSPERILFMGQRHYEIPVGHHTWKLEDLTCGEMNLRKKAWFAYYFLKDNVPGFENAYVEQTPVHLLMRDAHRIEGEYVLTEDDIIQGKTFDDSVVISNMSPEVWGPRDDDDAEYRIRPLYDVPYRCLVPKETENLLTAGSTISVDFKVYAGMRYIIPSISTGQASGTAAALAVKNRVTPRELEAKLVQETLRKQGIPFSIKHLPKEVLDDYQKRVEKFAHVKTPPDAI